MIIHYVHFCQIHKDEVRKHLNGVSCQNTIVLYLDRVTRPSYCHKVTLNIIVYPPKAE